MVRNAKLVKIIAVILAFTCMFSTCFTLVSSAAAVEVFQTEAVPVNPNANKTCKNFYQYLWNVRKSGDLISGAVSNRIIGINGETADAENDYHQYIKDIFGVTPVIMGNHLSLNEMNENTAKVLAERYKEGAIPMFQVDPGDPSPLGDNRKNGIVHYDETNEERNMELYNSYLSDREKLGDFCLQMEEAGIEVYIIRLYIENNNSSKRGFYGVDYIGYDAFKRVWKQTVEYLINERKVTGALFTYAPAGFDTSDRYYPGAEYVDINAPTVYANNKGSDGEIFVDECAEDYEWMRYENRPFGFSELAARSVKGATTTHPIGDYANTLDSLMYCFPELSFFVLWYENGFSIEPNNGTQSLGNYNGEYFIKNPNVIVAENALDYGSSKVIKSNGIATLYKDKSKKQSISLDFGNYSADSLKAKGINLSDIVSLDVLFGNAVALYETTDCTGEATMYFGDTENLNDIFKKINSISVIDLDNISLDKAIWSDNEDKSIYKMNNGKNDKYVTEAKNDDGSMDVTIDLGTQYVVGQVGLNLAGFFEDTIYNLRDFAIYVSNDDVNNKMVYKTIANTSSAANVYFDAVNARYIKLHIISPNNSSSIIENKRVSISEILVYGTDKVKISEDVVINGNMLNGESNSDNNQDLSFDTNNNGNLSNSYGDDMKDNNQEISANKDGDGKDKKPVLPKYEIPEFYNYVWLIFCGTLVVLIGAFWCVILLMIKKRRKEKN